MVLFSGPFVHLAVPHGTRGREQKVICCLAGIRILFDVELVFLSHGGCVVVKALSWPLWVGIDKQQEEQI